ncbi:hypothetical protein Pcinc_035698, partial [Petrolisthes cinctipes]
MLAWSIETEQPRSTRLDEEEEEEKEVVSRWTNLENSVSLRPHIRLMTG